MENRLTKSSAHLALSSPKLTAGAPELPMVRLLPIFRLPATANFRILLTTEFELSAKVYFIKINL